MRKMPSVALKTLFASLLLFGITQAAIAQIQGQVDFANLSAGCNAPISDASGYLISAPSPYVADLFWSMNTNSSMDNLTPAGHDTSFAPTNSYYGAGYFFGGAVNLPFDYILVQVRVWDTRYGSTYYEARDKGGEFGFSNLIIVLPDVPPGPPTFLYGLQSFQLQRLPHLSISPTPTNTLLFSWATNITSYALQQNVSLDSIHWTTPANTPVVIGFKNKWPFPNLRERRFIG